MRTAAAALAIIAAWFAATTPTIARAQQTEPPARLAVIVHQSNPLANLSASDLRRIFLLETQNWPHGRKITVVLREKDQNEREEALRLICGMSAVDYDRHVLFQTFRGAAADGPRSIRTASAMLRFVFNAPGAIGYVHADEVDASVKVLRIDGFDISDPRYPFTLVPPRKGRPLEAP
jgi:ABC-type phosphate transport system substrate-binding protein